MSISIIHEMDKSRNIAKHKIKSVHLEKIRN